MGDHSPTHRTGGIPVLQDGGTVSDPNDPKMSSKTYIVVSIVTVECVRCFYKNCILIKMIS